MKTEILTGEQTTLQLVLKTKWFRMIESGEKLQEYRDITPYWWKRIFQSDFIENPMKGGYAGKHRFVRFRLGYKKNAEEMTFKLGHIGIGNANPDWAEGSMDKMIVLNLQERIK